MRMTEAHNLLASKGIRTTVDLDAYRARTNPCESRFGILKGLIGFDAAMWMLNDLAIDTCCKAPAKAKG